MAVVGVQMMMLKEQVAAEGMFPVLEKLKDLNVGAVEMSQIPMDERNVADLEHGIKELGIEVGAISAALKSGPTATGDALDTDLEKIIADCRRLNCRYVRIGMMAFDAMASKEAAEAWARECNVYAEKLAEAGITLCYHNHHVDLAKFDGERIFDIVRRVAPAMKFEVDLHWVQRGGMAPLDMLAAYTGVCKLIHVKDFRVSPLPQEAIDAMTSGDMERGFGLFLNIAQFAEVGQGNMNWPALLSAALDAGAEYFFIEQDDTYGRDPLECIKDSREYLASIGY